MDWEGWFVIIFYSSYVFFDFFYFVIYEWNMVCLLLDNGIQGMLWDIVVDFFGNIYVILLSNIYFSVYVYKGVQEFIELF